MRSLQALSNHLWRWCRAYIGTNSIDKSVNYQFDNHYWCHYLLSFLFISDVIHWLMWFITFSFLGHFKIQQVFFGKNGYQSSVMFIRCMYKLCFFRIILVLFVFTIAGYFCPCHSLLIALILPVLLIHLCFHNVLTSLNTSDGAKKYRKNSFRSVISPFQFFGHKYDLLLCVTVRLWSSRWIFIWNLSGVYKSEVLCGYHRCVFLFRTKIFLVIIFLRFFRINFFKFTFNIIEFAVLVIFHFAWNLWKN